MAPASEAAYGGGRLVAFVIGFRSELQSILVDDCSVQSERPSFVR